MTNAAIQPGTAMTMMPGTDVRADLAVLIGRFQPFHNGHALLLRRALAIAPKVVVVLGSSFHARNAKNPFTWQERAAMIGCSLSEDERGRVSYLPLRDYYDDRRWADAVRERVGRSAGDARDVALVGHFKDASSYYLNLFPDWHLAAVESELDADATAIRRVLFEAEDLEVAVAALESVAPQAVCRYLKAWAMLPHFPPLAEEHAKVMEYQAAWSKSPYPPIFTTVDAVVKTAGHVLLVKRGDYPGKGLWATPGGFVEPRERLLQSVLRELEEETQLGVLRPTMENALADVKVFYHPDRSQRGRTITHAHFFDLKTEHLPAVEGGDDAAQASWVPIAELAAMEDSFFDDHFHILDHFLNITGD